MSGGIVSINVNGVGKLQFYSDDGTPTGNLIALPGNGAALEAGGNLAAIANQTNGVATAANQLSANNALVQLHTDNGTGGTGIVPPAGGAGVLGWLSGVYSKLSGTLTTSVTGSVATTVIDGGSAAVGAKADTAYADPTLAAAGSNISLLKGIFGKLAGTLATSVTGSVATTVIDGGSVAQGAKADTAYADATLAAAGSNISLLKGIFGKLANLLGVQNKANLQWNEATGVVATGTSSTGAWRDTGVVAGSAHPFSYFNGSVSSDQTGTLYIEGTNDAGATTFPQASQAVAAGTPIILNVPVLFKQSRVRFANTSGSATAVFCMNSSYTGA